MKNFAFFTLLILSLSACSGKMYDQIVWQDSEVIIDGEAEEWDVPLKYFDKTAQLAYTFSDDKTAIYFAASTTDKTTIKQILTGGLKLEIDTTGKGKDYTFALTYPVRPMHPGGMGGMHGPPPGGGMPSEGGMPPEGGMTGSEPGDFDPSKHQGPPNMEMQSNMEISGFNGLTDTSEVITISDDSDIQAHLQMADSVDYLFMEVKIPFATFYKEQLAAKDSNLVYSIKLTLMESSMPQMGGNGPQMGGQGAGPGMGGPGMGGPGGMGGGPGGMGGGPGMGGAPPQGMMDSDSQSEKNCEIITKIQLTYK